MTEVKVAVTTHILGLLCLIISISSAFRTIEFRSLVKNRSSPYLLRSDLKPDEDQASIDDVSRWEQMYQGGEYVMLSVLEKAKVIRKFALLLDWREGLSFVTDALSVCSV